MILTSSDDAAARSPQSAPTSRLMPPHRDAPGPMARGVPFGLRQRAR